MPDTPQTVLVPSSSAPSPLVAKRAIAPLIAVLALAACGGPSKPSVSKVTPAEAAARAQDAFKHLTSVCRRGEVHIEVTTNDRRGTSATSTCVQPELVALARTCLHVNQELGRRLPSEGASNSPRFKRELESEALHAIAVDRKAIATLRHLSVAEQATRAERLAVMNLQHSVAELTAMRRELRGDRTGVPFAAISRVFTAFQGCHTPRKPIEG
jgi:hypothetical protein